MEAIPMMKKANQSRRLSELFGPLFGAPRRKPSRRITYTPTLEDGTEVTANRGKNGGTEYYHAAHPSPQGHSSSSRGHSSLGIRAWLKEHQDYGFYGGPKVTKVTHN